MISGRNSSIIRKPNRVRARVSTSVLRRCRANPNTRNDGSRFMVDGYDILKLDGSLIRTILNPSRILESLERLTGLYFYASRFR